MHHQLASADTSCLTAPVHPQTPADALQRRQRSAARLGHGGHRRRSSRHRRGTGTHAISTRRRRRNLVAVPARTDRLALTGDPRRELAYTLITSMMFTDRHAAQRDLLGEYRRAPDATLTDLETVGLLKKLL